MKQKIALCQKPIEFFKERVSVAISRNKISVSETAEFYLCDLLERYMVAHNLQNDPLAIQLLKAQQSGIASVDKIKILKNLGDTSLYVSGFFGDSLNRKVVDLDYYRQMGSIAYRALSETIKDQQFHELYNELYNQFSGFVQVLSELSHELMPKTDQNLLHLYEVYAKTGSEALKKYLIDQGLPDVLKKRNV